MDPIYEGPYTVVRMNNQGSYTLKDTTGEILPRSFAPTQLKLVANSDHDEDNCFEVESILDARWNKKINKYEYLIKWKNYDDNENTWEPVDHIHSDRIINDYWNNQSQKPRKARHTNQSKKRLRKSK